MYLAIDVGATSIKFGVYFGLDPETMVYSSSNSTENNFDTDVKNLVNSLIENGVNLVGVEAVGLGTPGTPNESKTGLLSAANLSGWVGVDVKSEFEKEFGGCEVFIENDAITAAMSQSVFGGVKEEFVFVSWGSGLGATKVIQRGGVSEYQQVSLGYQTINERFKNTSEPGYLELYCGGKNLKTNYGVEPENLSEDNWQDILNHMQRGLVNFQMLSGGRSFVFGGKVSLKNPVRIKQLEKLVAKNNRRCTDPEFALAKFGEDAGVVGALALIVESLD